MARKQNQDHRGIYEEQDPLEKSLDPEEIRQAVAAIDQVVNGISTLKSLGIVRSQRWHADIGEWIVAQIFGGVRASNRTQKRWDVREKDADVQVKAHWKAETNNAAYTEVGDDLAMSGIDLAVILFNPAFRVKEVRRDRISRVRIVEGKNGKKRIYWKDVKLLWPGSLLIPLHLQPLFEKE